MTNLFLGFLNRSLSAAVLIFAVVLVRLAFKKAPKWLLCALWALAAVRLLCPFSIESVLSLIPSAEPVQPEIVCSAAPAITSGIPAVDAIVNVDEMHFTNVIFNLLDNAFKYRNENRPLQLSVSTRDISNQRLEIVIADNGIGIRKEDLKKIFEKFYRVSTGNRHDV